VTAYEELLARARAEIEPVNILEEIWVREIVDLAWDVLRLRRLRDTVIQGRISEEAKERGHLDTFMSQTLELNLDAFERMDGLIASATARSMALVRELDRHRAARRELARPAVQQLEHLAIAEQSADGTVDHDQRTQD
jgi:hypothetical protein